MSESDQTDQTDRTGGVDRIETARFVAATPAEVFAVLRDPQGHVAIDASGMLQDADGELVSAPGDRFVVHMDRESLDDIPDYGRYDVVVVIAEYEPDTLISWTIEGRARPFIGHVYGYRLEQATEERDGVEVTGTRVVSFYDWSDIHPDWKGSPVLPVLDETALKGTLGILDRTVRRGYPRR